MAGDEFVVRGDEAVDTVVVFAKLVHRSVVAVEAMMLVLKVCKLVYEVAFDTVVL